MTRREIIGWALVVILALVYWQLRNRDCAARGGVLVRGLWTWQCAALTPTP